MRLRATIELRDDASAEKGGTMAGAIRDPVSRVRQAFEARGESLIVDNWLGARDA
jgi:hypothetical protein